MIRIIVCGACGKMGTRILGLAGKNKEIKIAGALETQGHPWIGKPLPDGKISVTSDLESLKDSADVLIDFTIPSATLSHLETIRK